jgi:hypothetical protein
MSSVPDLSGLAALARNPHLDLRAVILRVQTDLFLAAPQRDPETVASFEALATGLIATVDDGTLAIVAEKLGGFAETPAAVRAALTDRGVHLPEPAPAAPPARLPEPPRDERTRDEWSEPSHVDALAEALSADPIPHPRLAALLEWAKERPALAGALLRRPDLSFGERAALYRQAGPEERSALRQRANALAALRPTSLRRASPDDRADLVALAEAGEADAFASTLSRILGWPLSTAELIAPGLEDNLALALRAVDLPEEEAVRILLTLTPSISHSVALVFGLTEILRTISRPGAALLLEAILDAKPEERAGHRPLHEEGSPVRTGRPLPARTERPAARRQA